MKRIKPVDILLSYKAAAALFLLLAVIAASVIFYFSNLVQTQLYSEAVGQLTETENQSSEKLRLQLNTQWSYLAKLDGAHKNTPLMTADELASFLFAAEKDMLPPGKKARFLAVDENGAYYTADGRQGKWKYADRLTLSDGEDDGDASDKKECFVVSGWPGTASQMVFAYKSDTPLTVGGCRIGYFVLIRSMTDMAPYLKCSSYGGAATTFLANASGTKLFADNAAEGLDFEGRNIYYALREQAAFPHAGNFDGLLKSADENGFVCTDVRFGGSDYYLCMLRPDGYDWALLTFVPVGEVASATRIMAVSLMQYCLASVALIVLTVGFGFLFFVRFRKEKCAARADANAGDCAVCANRTGEVNGTLEANEPGLPESNKAAPAADHAPEERQTLPQTDEQDSAEAIVRNETDRHE